MVMHTNQNQIEPSKTRKQIQFNKGISRLSDKLTATIIEEPYYLRIKIINLFFIEGFDSAAELVIDISDKDKLIIANYLRSSSLLNSKTIEINKEYNEIKILNKILNLKKMPKDKSYKS